MSVDLTSSPKTHPDSRSQRQRLEAWKEIASYLGRDVTTVRRWEKREGLPVHRLHHSKLGSVYAFTKELDAWRKERASGAVPCVSDSDFVPATSWLAGRSPKAIVLVGLVLMLAAALIAGLTWFVRERTVSPPAYAGARIRALAVLPLENFSGNPEQDYLSDGMTEALISRLSAIHALRVISRTSVMHFKGTRKSLPAIGKELDVDAVVEGSVLRSGDKIRITVQLIRANTDEHLWSGTYDRELQDVLALQNDVTYGIARHIKVAVTGAPTGSTAAPRTVAPEVYEAYLKGRFALHKNSRTALEEARQRFQAAIDADATFAPAYAGIAATYSALGLVFYGEPPGETRPKVLAAARKAVALDAALSDARAELGDALQKDWHWAQAEAEYRRAIELSPNNAAAHGGLAQWLLCQGRTEEALASARRAQELDPQEFEVRQVGAILFYSHRFDEAIRELRTTLTIDPNDPLAAWYFGFALNGAKQYDEAITALQRAASLSDRSSAV